MHLDQLFIIYDCSLDDSRGFSFVLIIDFNFLAIYLGKYF